MSRPMMHCIHRYYVSRTFLSVFNWWWSIGLCSGPESAAEQVPLQYMTGSRAGVAWYWRPWRCVPGPWCGSTSGWLFVIIPLEIHNISLHTTPRSFTIFSSQSPIKAREGRKELDFKQIIRRALSLGRIHLGELLCLNYGHSFELFDIISI